MKTEFDFCSLQFSENYVISNIYEGVTLDIEKGTILIDHIVAYYKEKPFVYITHRVHSYSVDPIIYNKTSSIETLAGFVVVSESMSSVKNALFEKMFLDKPFEIFQDLDDAILWADTICNMKRRLE